MRAYEIITEGKSLAEDMLGFLQDVGVSSEEIERYTANASWMNRAQKTLYFKQVRLNVLSSLLRRDVGERATIERHIEKYSNPEELTKVVQYLLSKDQWMDGINWNQPVEELLRELEATEKKYYLEKKRSGVAPQDGDNLIIDLGNGWGWWHLSRGVCSDEGEAMRHCGNDEDYHEGETILSFRQDLGNGRWRPKLTAVLDEDGGLGQIRGYANSVPHKKYHPALVALFNAKREGHFLVKNLVNTGMEDLFLLDQMDLSTLKKIDRPLAYDMEIKGEGSNLDTLLRDAGVEPKFS